MFKWFHLYVNSYDFFSRTIPRSIIVVKLAVIVMFVLVNVAPLAVLGPEDIRESSAVAMVTIICWN